jgi:HAD superfamily hydrolase (TIGR01509 family)
MPIPQAVVFDLGKVLVDFDYAITARNLVAHCKITITELQHLIDQSTLLHRYETGHITTHQFYDEVKAATGYGKTFEEFCDVFGDIFTPIEEMIELHAMLRAHHIPTYIFSNTNELAVRHIRRHFPFFTQFNDHVFSYEHRSMKPHSRLYEVVEQVSGRKGKSLCYIDDRPENIAAGEERGWRAVLHENPAKTIAAVKATGILG